MANKLINWKDPGFRISVAIFALTLLALLLFPAKKIREVGEEPLQVLTDLPLAQPINLTHFVWKTPKQERMFYRTQVNDAWNPPVESAVLHPREALFDGLTTWAPVTHGAPRLLIRGQFLGGIVGNKPEANQWVELGWDGTHLFLTSGPHAGKGRTTTDAENLLLSEGDLAFDSHAVDWCGGRLVVIKHEGKVFAEFQDGRWLTRKVGGNEPLNTNGIEAWMGQHCRFKAAAILDPQFSSNEGLPRVEYEFLFKGGAIRRMWTVGEDRIEWGPRTYVAPEMVKALRSLSGQATKN